MNQSVDSHSDPLAGSLSEATSSENVVESTLRVDRSTSLTLATDSLIILDGSPSAGRRRRCCGLLADKSKTTRAMPFYNILWAELSGFNLTVNYAQSLSQTIVRASSLNFVVEKTDRSSAATWVERLQDRAYGKSQRRKRVKVLINAFSGKGSAQKWYLRDIEPMLAGAGCEVDVEKTEYQGHAVDIAEKIDTDAYDVIACCSGDGVPHEVFNGLGKRADARLALARLAVVQLPCGSGNAMSWNLNGTGSPSLAALSLVKGLRTPLDLVSITQDNRRSLSFLSQAVGVVAESDLGTEHLRWMGDARFTFGFLTRLLGKTVYPCDLAVKVEIADKSQIKEHYRREVERAMTSEAEGRESGLGESADSGLPALRYGSVTDDLPGDWRLVPYDKLGNFYAGNMAFMAADTNFFPACLPHDGNLDLVCIDGDVSRLSALQFLTAIESRTLFDMSAVSYRKVTGYRIIPKVQKAGIISIDGERVPFGAFQAEVHKGLGTVLSRSGHVYEAWGVS